MSGDAQLMLMIAGVHLLGLVCAGVLLIPALRDTPMPPRRDSGSDEGGGGGPPLPPVRPGPPTGGIPLPDALQSAVRLRERGRLADRMAKRGRRPAREPDRRPVRT